MFEVTADMRQYHEREASVMLTELGVKQQISGATESTAATVVGVPAKDANLASAETEKAKT